MNEQGIRARDPAWLAEAIGEARTGHLIQRLRTTASRLDGRTIVNVNATAAGGGVADMLRTLLGYALHEGIQTRWLVIEGDHEFFTITKRIHARLYGLPGDRGPLGAAEHRHYRDVLSRNAEALVRAIEPGDVVIIHDPQPAGLAAVAAHWGGQVTWRCHVGVDEQNEHSHDAWRFLRPYLEPHTEQYVFTRRAFAPQWVPETSLRAIAPTIDPVSPKNQALPPGAVESILTRTGLVAGRHGTTTFRRLDGSSGQVERRCEVIGASPPAPDVPLVVQLSRWDAVKDKAGVMASFAEWVPESRRAHLLLAGPAVTAVADDPRAQAVLEACIAKWHRLPPRVRGRITLASLPMDDLDENAAIVNAIQRHAAVVTQKSLAEGFGLGILEAQFKGRPVVASAVGGIKDQVVDGHTGVLVNDPTDLHAFGAAIGRVLGDSRLAADLGREAKRRVSASSLVDTHLDGWMRWAPSAPSARPRASQT